MAISGQHRLLVTHLSGYRQHWLPAGMKLLIDGPEDQSRRGVVAHQRHELDHALAPEQLHGPGEGLRLDSPAAKELPAEADDRRLLRRQTGHGSTALHDIDDLLLQPLDERGGLVRRPLELAVELARRDEDRQLGQAAAERGVEAQVLVDRALGLAEPGAMEPNPTRPLQPDQRPAPRAHDRVVETLALLVHFLARAERQTRQRIGVHVRGQRGGRRRGGAAAGATRRVAAGADRPPRLGTYFVSRLPPASAREMSARGLTQRPGPEGEAKGGRPLPFFS